MLNTLDYIRELINQFKNEYDFGKLDYLLEEKQELTDYLKQNNITFKYVERIDIEEHRWYTIDTDVYQFFENGESIGYLAISEVGMMKSECMCYEDCMVGIEAHSVKEITKRSFEVI